MKKLILLGIVCFIIAGCMSEENIHDYGEAKEQLRIGLSKGELVIVNPHYKTYYFTPEVTERIKEVLLHCN